MRKLTDAVGAHSRTVITHVVEFSLFGGIVTALAAAVIRLK